MRRRLDSQIIVTENKLTSSIQCLCLSLWPKTKHKWSQKSNHTQTKLQLIIHPKIPPFLMFSLFTSLTETKPKKKRREKKRKEKKRKEKKSEFALAVAVHVATKSLGFAELERTKPAFIHLSGLLISLLPSTFLFPMTCKTLKFLFKSFHCELKIRDPLSVLKRGSF